MIYFMITCQENKLVGITTVVVLSHNSPPEGIEPAQPILNMGVLAT